MISISKRYNDDIFMIWLYSIVELYSHIDGLNSTAAKESVNRLAITTNTVVALGV